MSNVKPQLITALADTTVVVVSFVTESGFTRSLAVNDEMTFNTSTELVTIKNKHYVNSPTGKFVTTTEVITFEAIESFVTVPKAEWDSMSDEFKQALISIKF